MLGNSQRHLYILSEGRNHQHQTTFVVSCCMETFLAFDTVCQSCYGDISGPSSRSMAYRPLRSQLNVDITPWLCKLLSLLLQLNTHLYSFGDFAHHSQYARIQSGVTTSSEPSKCFAILREYYYLSRSAFSLCSIFIGTQGEVHIAVERPVKLKGKSKVNEVISSAMCTENCHIRH